MNIRGISSVCDFFSYCSAIESSIKFVIISFIVITVVGAVITMARKTKIKSDYKAAKEEKKLFKNNGNLSNSCEPSNAYSPEGKQKLEEKKKDFIEHNKLHKFGSKKS